jgi:hypothetical protein
LVKRIAELHGGTIVARSAGEGCGSTFQVRLALAPPRSAEEDPVIACPTRAVRAPSSSQTTTEMQPSHWLVLVQLEGHEVEIAFDGAEARFDQHLVKPVVCALPQDKCYPTGSLPHLRCYRRAGV